MKVATCTKLVLLLSFVLLPGCVFIRPPVKLPPPYADPKGSSREDIEDIQQQLDSLELRLSALEGSLNKLRRELEGMAWSTPQVETVVVPGPEGPVEAEAVTPGDVLEFTVVEVKVGWLSGPIARDGDGIDDGLVVYVSPTDRDGDATKRVGRVQVALLDVTSTRPVTLMSWDFPPEQVAKRWSWIARGYYFELLWQGREPPKVSGCCLKVTFTDRTGNVFSDTKNITISRAKPEVD